MKLHCKIVIEDFTIYLILKTLICQAPKNSTRRTLLSQRFMLYLIDDGEWHSLTEVAEELEWPTQEVVEAAKYLAQGRFIHYNEQSDKVKLQPWVRKYPRGEWKRPGKKSTGTISIPPDGSVILQETLIQNGLDVEAEVYFMVVDDKLAELFITKGARAPSQPPY